MRIAMLCLMMAGAAGCAAGMAAPKAVQRVEPPQAPQEPEKTKTVYARILSAFNIEPDMVIYLNPALLQRHYSQGSEDYGFARLVERFRVIQSPRGEAAARLNWGAVLFQMESADRSYEEVMQALNLFSEIGDVQGLAHAHEWVGFLMRESGELDRASDHLAVAYQLFGMLENESAQKRVLAYAED